MQKMKWGVALAGVMGLVLGGCGGGTGGGDSSSAATPGGATPPATRSAVFLDSPVAGLSYTSGGQSGTTGADGSFTCEVDQPVVFSIGNTRLPPVTCTSTTEVVTPLSVFAASSVNDTRVENLARLLQTLDSDGNPDNGISIASQVHTSGASLPASIDFSSTAAFESAVTGLVTTLASASVIPPTTTLVTADAAKAHLQAQTTSIAGAWSAVVGAKRILLTFLSNGTYVHSESGPADTAGQTGMERGTYTWNASTGAFASTCPSVDTNGEWGLSHEIPGTCSGTTATVTVSGNTLRLQVDDDVLDLTRVIDALNPIVGAWWFDEGSSRTLVTFLPSGTYVHVEDGTSDPNGQNGSERGTYTWNAGTGAFATTCPVTDTNGEWGLSHGTPGVCSGSSGTVSVSGNTLTMVLSDGDSMQLTRVTP